MSTSASHWHGIPMTGSGTAGWRTTLIRGCLLLTGASAGVLHVTGSGLVDPARTVISDYVRVPGGYVLLAVAALAFATACLAVAAMLRPADLPRPELPIAVLVSAAMGLVMAAVFPTNLPGTPAGAAANVHRAAAGVVFATLPMAGWLVAVRARESSAWARFAPLLRRCAAVTGAISGAYLLSHVPIVIAGSSGFPYNGGAERVLCVAVIVVLLMTARAARIAIESARMHPEPVTSRPATRAGATGALAGAGPGRPA